MRRQGGGFGVVILLVVVAIVLYLATRSWESTLPTAAEISKPGAGPAATSLDTGSPNSGESVPARPSLNDMKSATDAHTSNVKESLDQAQ